MPRTCWACDPSAPTTPWPVLHLIARHHTHPTTHLPPRAYAWVAPWFHRTDTNPTVVWDPEHEPQWLFTRTPTWPRPDPSGIAIRYSMYELGRTGKHEHPYYTPPLVPHTGAPNANPHVPKPKPGHGLHPPLHLLLPHTTRRRTHSCVPLRETHHLQRGRGIRHPHRAAHDPMHARMCVYGGWLHE